MILAFVRMEVLPEKRKELRQTIHSIVSEMKTENGCTDSRYYQNIENENEFLLIGEWENRESLDDHLQSNRFTVLMGARSLMSQPPEIVIQMASQSSIL